MESNDLVKDIFKDVKHQRIISAIIIFLLSVAVIILGITLFKVSTHCQDLLKEMAMESDQRMIELLSETEFTTEYQIDTDNQAFNTGNITVNK